MFEDDMSGASVSKAKYEEQLPALRVDLLNLQFDLRSADFPVLIVIDGADRPGCDEVLNLLGSWLDTRYLKAHGFGPPSDEERERPLFWRYWRVLPRRGRIASFVGGWNWNCIVERGRKNSSKKEFRARLKHNHMFERTLTADGALLIKLWLHLPKEELEERVRKADQGDADAWQILPGDREILDRYESGLKIIGEMFKAAQLSTVPWHVINSSCDRHRNLEVGRILRDALSQALTEKRQPNTVAPCVSNAPIDYLSTIDLSRELTRDDYSQAKDKLQYKLLRLSRRASASGLSTVMAFEGWDAAGKGGAIRRLTSAMQARHYRVVPISAPTEDENSRHYLWRFWHRLPRAGNVLIFDRSWYGRVLVERVERFAHEDEWRRAYEEINDFEEQLVTSGMILLKFWLHIDADEQLRRFRERETTSYKRHKIVHEDYRNREKWDAYVAAANEMISHTHKEGAPWHLISGTNKYSARIEILRIVCEALEKRLD